MKSPHDRFRFFRSRAARFAAVALFAAAAISIGFGVARYRSNAELQRLVGAGRFGGYVVTTHHEGPVHGWLVVLSDTQYGPLPAVGDGLRDIWRLLGEPTGVNSEGPGCDFKQAFPRLADAALLEEIDLTECGTIGGELGELSRCGRLRSLWVGRMHFTPEAVRAFGRLRRLEELTLWKSTGIDDAAAAEIAKLTRLRRLSLVRASVTDVGVERLSALPALDRLSLAGTRVTDASVSALIRMAPQRLELSGTDLTTQGVARLRAALPNSDVRADF